MSLWFATRRIFRILPGFKCIYDCYWHCGSSKEYTRYVYSVSQQGCRNFSQFALKEGSRRVKQLSRKNVDPKVYMRVIVREISNILRYCSWDSAREQLERVHVKWDSYTVNQVLKTHPPMEKAWLFFNWVSKLKGFKHDQFTYTTMLSIFGEARRVDSMKFVFHQMQENGIMINAVTYTALLHWLSNNGDFHGAVKVWEEMKSKCCHPTVVSYTAYMKVLFDNDRAQEAVDIYKEMLQSGMSPTCHTYTILMEHLIRSGKCKSALQVFEKMQETGVQADKATCNILVEQFSKAGEACGIIQILRYMKEYSLVLRYPVFVKALETLKMAGENDTLLRQVNPHIRFGGPSESEVVEFDESASLDNSTTDRGLVVKFLRQKNFVAIDHLLNGMADHNISLDAEIVSKIIEANCAHGRTDAALLAFQYSIDLGIHIEQVAYLSLLGVLMRANEFSKILQIVEQMVKIGLYLESQLATALIYRLGQARDLDSAVKVFDLLPEEAKSTTVYTALIDACFASGDPDKGILEFNGMKNRGIHIALATYNVLLRGLELCGRVDEAKFYRKEKKCFQRESHVSETILMEERTCDLLFAGYMVS